MKYFFLAFLGSLIFFKASTQTKTFSFSILDIKNNKIPYASLRIASIKDSLKKFSFIADSNGVVTSAFIPNKWYAITIEAIGYKKIQKNLQLEANYQLSFKLIADPNQLQEVVVKSTKSIIRQEDDKSVVDPEVLAESSTNAMETLEKVPGIFIDADGQIYLGSLSPAAVQINGRDLKMGASDMSALLKSLPPNSIQKIELVRTPSAKYDASGGGGVVNIILKKGIKLGMNGSINTGLSQGVYGNQFVGINLTNSNDKLNSYINAQFNNNKEYSINNTNRILSTDSILQQKSRTLSPNYSYYLGWGLSKNIKKDIEISYDSRLSNQNLDNSTSNISSLNKIKAKVIDNIFNSVINNKGNNSSMNQSVRFKWKIDTTGGEWVTDFSYNFSKSTTDQVYVNYMIASNMTNGGGGNFGNDRTNFVYQTDFKIKRIGLVWETGIKSSVFNTNNASVYTTNNKGAQQPDLFRTGAFNYKEQINAGYIQGAKTWGPVILKFGTRFEQTITSGHQLIPKDTTFLIHRTDAFPYVFLSRKIIVIAGYELRGYLVYRKTISRPTYDLLNPFPKYIDAFTYESGNPSLRPQFTSNYEANISVDDKPLFAFGVNQTKDIFTNVIYQSPTNKQVFYRTYDNLAKSKETYFRIIGAIPPGGKYFAVIGTQYNRNEYTGFYDGKPLIFDKATWSFFTFQTFKIDKLSTISINGFWRTNGQQQFYELENFGQANITINRQFINKKLTITATVNDIFKTNKINFTILQGSVNANGYRENDTRRFGLNMRYNFGFKPKPRKFDIGDGDIMDSNK